MSIESTFAKAGLTVFERGWLSSNNVLFKGDGPTALVDSGYATHAAQTIALVRNALGSQSLDHLLNTHLHSDHCGGNARLQAEFPAIQTWIPPGQAKAVMHWDPQALSFEPTGQICESFTFQHLLTPGSTVQLGRCEWEVHAAKGHDPHSVVLFQPELRILVSADALWAQGFGVVFPELEGSSAFDEVGQTLALIEALEPMVVIPGHGPVFNNLGEALLNARARLDGFTRHPEKHTKYALKVLLKFKLLEWQRVTSEALLDWCSQTSYIRLLLDQLNIVQQSDTLTIQHIKPLLMELERSEALSFDGACIVNR